MKSLLTLALCLTTLPLAAQDQLSYDVPQGWSRTPDPRTGLVALAPPGLRAPHFCVIR